MIISKIHKLFSPDNELFDFLIKFLFIVGLWPKEFSSKFHDYLYKIYQTTLYIISFLFLVSGNIGTYQNKDDLILVLSNIDKTLVAHNFFLKAVCFTWKRKEIQILINDIVSSGDFVSRKHKNLMNLHVVVVWTTSSVIAGVFIFIAICNEEMVVEAWMPFDPLKNRMNQLISTQVLLIAFFICSIRATAMQGIVCGLLMYLCDQLVEVQNRIKDLQYAPAIDLSMRNKFKEIIKKHVRIMRYAQSMTNYFKEYFFVQNLAITLELCLNAVMISIVGFEQKTIVLTFISFLIAALLNAYIYCYLCHELIVQSTGVALAAYESEWTNWPVGLQKELLIVIRAAQKPMLLTAGGIATMSIQTFSQALYNGYSIFAVLNDFV